MTWLSGWSYRKAHTLTGSTAGAQTNYQVGVKVYYGNGTDGTEALNGSTFGKVYCNSQCKTDFGDIRFALGDGTLLDYWIQSQTNSDNAVIRVEVDSIPASPYTKDIYVYYGNSGASSLSSFANTFVEGDTFTRADSSSLGNTEVRAGAWGQTGYDGYGADFRINSGALKNYKTDTGMRGANHPYSQHDLKLEFDLYVPSGGTTNWGGCTIRAAAQGQYFVTSGILIVFRDNGQIAVAGGSASGDTTGTFTAGQTNHITVLACGNSIKVYVNDSLQLDFTEATESGGYMDFACYGTLGSGYPIWDKFALSKYVSPDPAHTSWGNEETGTTYTLTISAGSGGTTDPTPDTYTYNQGSNAQVTANPNIGYDFDHWILDNSDAGYVSPITVTMNGNHTLSAIFTSNSRPATQSNFLRIKTSAGIYALSAVPTGSGASGMGGTPKIRRNGVTYDVYLVSPNNEHASPVRIQTTSGTQAARYYTTHTDTPHSDNYTDSYANHPFTNTFSNIPSFSDHTNINHVDAQPWHTDATGQVYDSGLMSGWVDCFVDYPDLLFFPEIDTSTSWIPSYSDQADGSGHNDFSDGADPYSFANHSDIPQAQMNVNGFTIPHDDHSNAYSDTYADNTHGDTPHTDVHTNTPHNDTGYSDAFTDSYSDSFADTPFSNFENTPTF